MLRCLPIAQKLFFNINFKQFVRRLCFILFLHKMVSKDFVSAKVLFTMFFVASENRAYFEFRDVYHSLVTFQNYFQIHCRNKLCLLSNAKKGGTSLTVLFWLWLWCFYSRRYKRRLSLWHCLIWS